MKQSFVISQLFYSYHLILALTLQASASQAIWVKGQFYYYYSNLLYTNSLQKLIKINY